MSTIPIDHLSRDDLVTLLYRIAVKLATPPVESQPTKGMPYPVADCPIRNFPEAQLGCHRAVTTVQQSLLRPYEEEYDPWNAHLRSTTSASSSDVSYRTGPPVGSMPTPPLHRPPSQRDDGTTTCLSDAMINRYEQVAVLGTLAPCGAYTGS